MSVNIINFSKLSKLVSLNSLKKPKIVLNPEEEYIMKAKKNNENLDHLNVDIMTDTAKWKISPEIQSFVEELAKDNSLSNEEKILFVFEKLSKDYLYDDNILSYIKKGEEKYELPAWYGRNVDQEWEKNRESHNRRVCYEISRCLAKALTELFKDNNNINTCILWDTDVTHYYVGLTCNDYTLTLDLDNFDKIKDITRIKTGLTAEGIDILEDNDNKFKKALDHFNKGKEKYAVKKIEDEIKEKGKNDISEQLSGDEENEEDDDIQFLKKAMEILCEDYNIDSQGLFEYMKEIIDINIGPEKREKIWKKIKLEKTSETRYMRNLIVNKDNKKYLIDVDERIIRPFSEKEFEKDNSEFERYKNVSRDWDEHYSGL
jgi:hypothetical protein